MGHPRAALDAVGQNVVVATGVRAPLLAAVCLQGPADRALVRLRSGLAVPPALRQVVPKADTAIDDPGADKSRRAGIYAMFARVRLGELGIGTLGLSTQAAADLSRAMQSRWATGASTLKGGSGVETPTKNRAIDLIYFANTGMNV